MSTLFGKLKTGLFMTHTDVIEKVMVGSTPELNPPSSGPEDVNQLIAKRNYGRALELLKQQLRRDSKNVYLRQQYADVLVLAGMRKEAILILNRLADDFAMEGFAAKSIAVLKKIQRIDPKVALDTKLAVAINTKEQDERSRQARKAIYRAKQLEQEQISQPSTGRSAPEEAPAVVTAAAPPAITAPAPERQAAAAATYISDIEIEFGDLQSTPPAEPSHTEAPLPAMTTTPLFQSFSQEELLSVIKGLQLLSFEAGDIIVAEGEPGDSLFILTSGRVKAFVKNQVGHYGKVRELYDGDFFGEISLLTGKLRTATITAATNCDLLVLDRASVDSISQSHPHVPMVLQQFYDSRTNSEAEVSVRRTFPGNTRVPGS